MSAHGDFEIIRLTDNDLGLFDELMTCFGVAFDEPATYTQARPSPAYTRSLLSTDYFIALTAMKDGAVVGGLAAYELRKFEQERSEIYVYDLAVAALHRRQGIATALLGELRQLAAKLGAWVVFIQADADDEPAVSLYSKLGSREDAAHFDISVPQERKRLF